MSDRTGTLTENGIIQDNTKKENKKSNALEGSIFEWDDNTENLIENKEDTMPSIDELKAAKKPEVGNGVIIENPENKNTGNVIGPLAPGSDTAENVKQTEREMDMLIDIAKKRAIADGQKPKANTVVEILMDKIGMRTVEFTDEEKAKLKVAKKIKITAVENKDLKSITVTKPKALKQKEIIAKSFSKQYAPFAAVASGYIGKMKNLSSLEIINLVTIDERITNTAEATIQKASLIWSKMTDISTGDFANFDDFMKNTAFIDTDVFLYAIIRATYPETETIKMYCGNPKCTHPVRQRNGTITNEANTFDWEYKNNELLMVEKISDKLKDEAERIFESSFTKDDAIAAKETAIINQVKRFALGDDEEILIDIYCPSIYEYIDNVARNIDMTDYTNEENRELYDAIIRTAIFIKAIYLKDEKEGTYNEFSDIVNIIDIMTKMDQDTIEVVQQCINDNILDYMYRYGFKANTMTCPHCGHTIEQEVILRIDQFLFLQAQHHMSAE